MPSQPRSGRFPILALLLALLAFAPSGASSLKLDIGREDTECVVEHAASAGDTFSGSFMLIEEGARLRRWDGVFDLTVKDESGYVVYTTRHSSEHRFEFNAERAGAHEFCFTNLKPRDVQLFYNAAVGHHYAHDAATSANVGELERALQSLRQVAGEVGVEVRYQKRREQAQRKTAESVNGRVTGYSILEACALIGTATFQANYVKKLFSQRRSGPGGGLMTGV